MMDKLESTKRKNLDSLDEVVAFHQYPPLFSAIGIADRLLQASFKLNMLVEKYIPQLSRNRLIPGIYQGWIVKYDGVDESGLSKTKTEMTEDYLVIMPMGSNTIVADLEKIDKESYNAKKVVILDIPHYSVRFPDIHDVGISRRIAYDRISNLKDSCISGI